MKLKILALLFLYSAISHAEIYGHFKLQDNEYFFESTTANRFPIKANTEELWFSLQTLQGREVLVRLPDSSPLITKAPVIAKATLEKKGVLEYSGNYQLNGELVNFRPGKDIDGTYFDEQSKQHFIGKNVITRGDYVNGVYSIASIIEADLFSALPAKKLIGTPEAQLLHSAFLYNPMDYVLNILPEYERSSSVHSFRGNLFDHQKSKSVKVGESVMIFTMSGHQGDDPISANGHLGVGLGYVQNDFSINGEIFNIYIPPLNRKEIVSGNTNWVDYFGHVISGQNNYRPTYTLLIYGVDQEKILRIRENLERYHAHFRVTEKQFSVSINCGTLTALAMARENIYGIHRNGKNGSKKFPVLPTQFVKPTKMSAGKQISYVLKNPLAEYMPRNIFESLLKNFHYLNTQEKLGATRVDYIFYGQTPSARLRGGIGTNSLGDELKAMILGKRSLPSID